MIRQTIYDELLKRLEEKRRFIQVLAGPRQVGKTTVARQVMEASKMPAHYASADEPTLQDRTWLQQQWDIARLKARERKTSALLVLDEIQKVANWSSVVKLLWDADTHSGVDLKVVLLGSSPLLIQSGLTESLAGRFEVIAAPHWSFTEMHEAFGWNLEQYIFYGAYPGAAELIGDPERWRRYILDALIETTISRDILLLTRVDKPALLRRLFQLGCAYSGQILSYQKMIGQLTDAGNTTTLAHYLELLQGARDEREWNLLREYLEVQQYLECRPTSWADAARIFFDLRRRGKTVRSPIDCCIAQLAIEHDVLLLHRDRDFEVIAEVAPLSQRRLRW